jgi:hypothetical protein
MDLSLNLDPHVNLSFGALTTDDLHHLRTEIEASGVLDPVLSSIARTVHLAATRRARGRDVMSTLKLPKITPEQAKKAAERVRHLLEATTGRTSLQSFLCEVCLTLLLDRPSRTSKIIRIEVVGYLERVSLVNKLLEEEE